MAKEQIRWTKEMVETLIARYPQEGSGPVAEAVGLSPSSVRHKAMRMGLVFSGESVRDPKFWTAEREQMVRNRYPIEGPGQLARELGKSEHAVVERARVLGVASRVKGKRIAEALRQRVTSVNLNYFDRWAPNMAWLLGFTWADGSIVAQRGSFSVRWGVSVKDRALIEVIKREIGSTHTLYEKGSGIFDGYATQPAVYLNVSSGALARILIERYGIPPRKSFIDPPYPAVPDEYAGHFARGYMDGDGSVSSVGVEPRLTLISGGSKFLEGLRDQISRLADVKRPNLSRSGSTWQITWGHRDHLRRLHAFLYPAGDYISLARKRDLLNLIVERA